MTDQDPSTELMALLGRAAEAMNSGDCDAAEREMAVAAALCERLQNAGVTLPAGQLAAVQEVAEQCGLALKRVGKELNAESQRDENHRRAFLTYQATQRR